MQLKTRNSILPLFPDNYFYLRIVSVLPPLPLCNSHLAPNQFVQFGAEGQGTCFLHVDSQCGNCLWGPHKTGSRANAFLLSGSSGIKILGKTCFQLSPCRRGFEATAPPDAV